MSNVNIRNIYASENYKHTFIRGFSFSFVLINYSFVSKLGACIEPNVSANPCVLFFLCSTVDVHFSTQQYIYKRNKACCCFVVVVIIGS